MQLIEIYKERANRAFRLSCLTRNPHRKQRLREAYYRYYRAYKKQQALLRGLESEPTTAEQQDLENLTPPFGVTSERSPEAA